MKQVAVLTDNTMWHQPVLARIVATDCLRTAQVFVQAIFFIITVTYMSRKRTVFADWQDFRTLKIGLSFATLCQIARFSCKACSGLF